jgi:hypothetical protein
MYLLLTCLVVSATLMLVLKIGSVITRVLSSSVGDSIRPWKPPPMPPDSTSQVVGPECAQLQNAVLKKMEKKSAVVLELGVCVGDSMRPWKPPPMPPDSTSQVVGPGCVCAPREKKKNSYKKAKEKTGEKKSAAVLELGDSVGDSTRPRRPPPMPPAVCPKICHLYMFV